MIDPNAASGSDQRPGSALKSRLATGDSLPAIGVYDVFSASIAAKYFDSVFLSGYGFTASQYGLPDEGYITWPDMVSNAERVRALLPEQHVIVDIDDGYGGAKVAVNVLHRLEQAGASAVVFEDQKRPKKCGHLPGKEVLPTTDYLQRLESLLRVRKDLLIVARTDAPFEEGLARARTYALAGADAVMVEGLRNLDQVRQVRDHIPAGTYLTVNLIRGGKTPPVSLTDLQSAGADIVIYSTPCLFPVQQAIEDAMQRLLAEDCVLGDSHGRIVLSDNNSLLVENRRLAGLDDSSGRN